MDNPKLKDLVINIDDTPIKEDPPKPKKVKVSRPRRPSKVKDNKDHGLKLLQQIVDSMSSGVAKVRQFWVVMIYFWKKRCNQILQCFIQKCTATKLCSTFSIHARMTTFISFGALTSGMAMVKSLSRIVKACLMYFCVLKYPKGGR